jgi:seryl-tRNA(Sec) selenium transferase
MEDVEVERTEASGDEATYEIEVTFRNSGGLPTALHQARLVKIVREDRVELELEEEAREGDEPRARVVGSDDEDVGWTEAGATNSARFQVEVTGPEPVEATVRVLSTRGGVLTYTFTIGGS